MTFSELTKAAQSDGKLPEGERQPASVVVRSAEGTPNKTVGINVRAPQRVTSTQVSDLRSSGAASA
jgi:hypothetical protein